MEYEGDESGLKEPCVPAAASEGLLGVKMCGNCNPDIRSAAVAARIARGLSMRIVPYGEGDCLLTLSACGAACVEDSYPADTVIRGLECNGVLCRDEDELVERAVRRLEQSRKGTHKGAV